MKQKKSKNKTFKTFKQLWRGWFERRSCIYNKYYPALFLDKKIIWQKFPWMENDPFISSVKWSHLRQIPNFKKVDLGHFFKSQGKIFLSFPYTLFFLIFETWKSILRHEKVSLVALFNITIIFYILFLNLFS